MSSKNIFNLLIKLKNASKSNCAFLTVKYSSSSFPIINLLYKQGYISYFFFKNKYNIIISLKYFNGYSLLNNLQIYNNPIRPYYIKYRHILLFYNGLYKNHYFLLLSTSYGLLTLEEIIFNNYKIGGQVLFSINYNH